MDDIKGPAVLPLDQAVALAALVELEAFWENLPRGEPREDLQASVQGLRAKQSAYVAYHHKLVAYNLRYKPAHEAETVLRSPVRLGTWCRKMRDLFQRLECHAACPVHVLEKTYRSADRIGARLNHESVHRTLPADMPTAIQELGALADWCDELAAAVPQFSPPALAR